MKKIFFLSFLSLLFLFPVATKAYTIKADEFIYISKDEVVEGNLYFMANSITVEGEILGDLIGLASNVSVNGHVSGDLITLAQDIKVNGQVDGNLRALASSATISGKINKNINYAGENLFLENDSNIGQDTLIAVDRAELKGKIKGNAHGLSNSLLILGSVDKNVDFVLDKVKRKKYLSTLKIGGSAEIGGDLNYQAGNEASIESENIKGNILHKEPIAAAKGKISISSLLYSILSLFILSVILRTLFKEPLKKVKRLIIKKNIRLSGWGLLFLFATPIIALLLMFTIIALPIAIIILIIWGLILYLSKAILAMALGDYIFRKLKKEKTHAYLRILLGLIIVCLLTALPYIGFIFSLLIISIGMGAFYELSFKKKNSAQS